MKSSNFTCPVFNSRPVNMLVTFLFLFGITFAIPAEETEFPANQPYVPGESYVEESGILKRMEAELGQKLIPETPTRQNQTKTASRELQQPEPQRIPLLIELKNGKSIRGHIQINLRHLEAIQKSDQFQQIVHLDFTRIAYIEILNWKAGRLAQTADADKIKVYYLPDEIIIHRIDGSSLKASLPGHSFLQIKLLQTDRTGNYRSYFTRFIKANSQDAKAILAGMDPIQVDHVPEHIIIKFQFQETKDEEKQASKQNQD